MQIPHDTAMAMKALSHQNQNGAEMDGIALSHPVDGLNCDGSQSRLRLDGEFLGSIALFTID
jgi:hypothetical protein